MNIGCVLKSEHPSTNARDRAFEFRVVRVNRGELITGYRVQFSELDGYIGQYTWKNCGRKYLTHKGAQDFKDYLQVLRSTQNETYTEIAE